MDTINRSKAQLFVAAVAALAIFAVAAVMLLAGGFATGPAQAQGGTGGGTGGTTFPDPQPCGPGQDNYPANHDEVVSAGHYALFDAYWQRLPGPDGNLHNNLCPPAAKHTETTVFGKKVTKTELSATNIDLRHTIIHVTDQHKVDVVATNAEASTDKLSLERYMEVRRALGLGETDPVPANTKVHWLRLEDLNIEPSSLVLGFSTGKLQDQHWYLEDEDGNPLKPFQYELEKVEYYGTHASDEPRLLTYWEPEKRVNGKSVVVWNSYDTDVNAMPQEAEEYEHLEWVFTKPGTYVLEVHLKGHVRRTPPPGAGPDWERITPNDTVTSEVISYVINVGPLTVNDKPMFGVMRSVNEHAMAGTKVGEPVKVFTTDDDKLDCTILEHYADRFDVDETDAGCQITVKNGALLDYETKETYHLELGVSDGKDHENNDQADESIDHTIVVQVTLIDVPPSIVLNLPEEDPRVGDTVTVRASYIEIQGYVPNSASWTFHFLDGNGNSVRTDSMYFYPDGHGEYDLTATEAGEKDYKVRLAYNIQGTSQHQHLDAEFSINWLPATPGNTS